MPSDKELDALIALPLEAIEAALTQRLSKLDSRTRLAVMEIILKKLDAPE